MLSRFVGDFDDDAAREADEAGGCAGGWDGWARGGGRLGAGGGESALAFFGDFLEGALRLRAGRDGFWSDGFTLACAECVEAGLLLKVAA